MTQTVQMKVSNAHEWLNRTGSAGVSLFFQAQQLGCIKAENVPESFKILTADLMFL